MVPFFLLKVLAIKIMKRTIAAYEIQPNLTNDRWSPTHRWAPIQSSTMLSESSILLRKRPFVDAASGILW